MKRTTPLPKQQKNIPEFGEKIFRGKREMGNLNNHSTMKLYNPERTPIMIYKLCLLGLTDREIADTLLIGQNTLSIWRRKYPAVERAMQEGKTIANAELITSLYQKANGYSHPDMYITVQKGKIYKVPYIKHYPPDTAAIIFMLKNRTRGQENPWTDVKGVEVTGKNGNAIDLRILQKFDESELHEKLQMFSCEELKMIPGISNKLIELKESNEDTK